MSNQKKIATELQARDQDTPQVQTPSRKVKSFKRAGVHVCAFPSIKNSTLAWCESVLESDFAQLLDYWPHITRYIEQAFTYFINIDGKIRVYTPDFISYHEHERPCLWEVKPNRWDEDPAMVARLQAARKRANKCGYNFEIVTEDVIRKDPLHKNLKLLYPRIRPNKEAQRRYLLSCIESFGGQCTVEDVLSLSSPPSWSSIASHLIYHSTELEFAPFSNQMILEGV